MPPAERIAERRRVAAERESLLHLKALVRGTRWRLSKTALCRQDDEWFFAAFLNTWRAADRVSLVLEVKPVAVDPLFWAIMDLEENARQPMSLRAWGAFVCDGIPAAQEDLSAPLPTPEAVASTFAAWATRAAEAFMAECGSQPFSQVVQAHPNFRERGAYATTFICSLILERRTAEALAFAHEVTSGRQRVIGTHLSEGRTFYERVESWLAVHPDPSA